MATVLVVDDEPDIVLFAEVNLELNGFDVLTAADGEEALTVIREQHPDVVLLDVMMPRLDGWSVLEQVKADADPVVRTIPVVMLTALASDQDQVRGGIEGAVIYLPKPVTPDAMVKAVTRALEGDPEPVQRRAAQQKALERLARMERGVTGAAAPGPRPRLGRLERPRAARRAPAARPVDHVELTDTQRGTLRQVKASGTVSSAAAALEMSRSNVYASLRRIGRKLGEPDVTVLLRRLSAGDFDHLTGD